MHGVLYLTKDALEYCFVVSRHDGKMLGMSKFNDRRGGAAR